MRMIQLIAGQLFDPFELKLVPNQVITVSNGSIVDVSDVSSTNISADAIDLSHLIVLPGFVDAHVHMFLHSYDETSWDDQLTKESLVERTIRATVHARKTLMAGFTTVRDLGTEGAEDADIFLRKCMSGPKALIPGPRYFCANRAIIASGSYGPKSYIHPHEEGREGVTGAQVVDGIEECVKAVRKQIGTGADWIKIYGDYRTRSRMADVSSHVGSQSNVTFNHEEMEAMIKTAHNNGVKVAVHAQTPQAIKSALSLGVDSVEHGCNLILDNVALTKLVMSERTTWVPTLSVFYKDSLRNPKSAWSLAKASFQKALELGMENVACGGDTGAFSHGENALEMKLMVKLGADWRKVLRWATLSGWELIRPMDWETHQNVPPQLLGDNDVRFGAIRPGWAADLVGVSGNFEKDFDSTVDNVQFVMKAGKVFKFNGREITDI